jgi:hypothetical protein
MHLRPSIVAPLLPHLLLALLLVLMLVLLRTLGLQERLRASKPPPGRAAAPAFDAAPASAALPARAPGTSRGFVAAGDTINGQIIGDPVIVERIERIAAALPADLLAKLPHAGQARYLAHGFGPGDDAPIYYGVFKAPAAALAFGCAVEDLPVDACKASPLPPPSLASPATPAGAATGPYQDASAMQCTPLRLAFGAPAYEPDRCEAGE